MKIPPFDKLRVVSPSTSFRINEAEPPEGCPCGLPRGGGEGDKAEDAVEEALLKAMREFE